VTLLASQRINAAEYVIDLSHSEVVVQLFKTGIGSALAHDHVVRAAKYTGQIFIDPAAPTAARITVEVDATALVADEPTIRQKYNLPLGLSEDSRQEIQQTLESESQLDVQRYPMIRFRSTGITTEGEGQYVVSGELELHGVTRTISLSLQGGMQKNMLRVTGSGRFLQSSFGYQPYSAFWGAVRNQDEVVLRVDIGAILK
jgi:polyisoprenoid-binding protein YceI